jgi:hypothetical protein
MFILFKALYLDTNYLFKDTGKREFHAVFRLLPKDDSVLTLKGLF